VVHRLVGVWRPVLLALCIATGLTYALSQHAHSPERYIFASNPSGTNVCGTLPSGTTTWVASGSPYEICAGGVTVPYNGSLVLDASGGGVTVQALGTGGIDIIGGALSDVGTSTTRRVSFRAYDASAAAGAWKGITLEHSPHATALVNDGSVSLTAADVAQATTCIDAQDAFVVALNDVMLANCSADGLALAETPTTLDHLSVADVGGSGVFIDHERGTGAQLSDISVARAAAYGIATSHGPFTLNGARITGSGTAAPRHPAIRLTDVPIDENAAQPTLAGLTGGGNGIDAVVLSGTIAGDFTWKDPTNSGAVHALGYLADALDVHGPGTFTVPANVTVKGAPVTGPNYYLEASGPQNATVTLHGEHFIAGAGSTFTSYGDDTVGPATCGSVLISDCSQRFGGIRLTSQNADGTGVLSDATLTGARFQQSARPLSFDAGFNAYYFGGGRPLPPAVNVTLTDVQVADCDQGIYVSDPSAIVNASNFTATGITRESLHVYADTLTMTGADVRSSTTDGEVHGLDLRRFVGSGLRFTDVVGTDKGALLLEAIYRGYTQYTPRPDLTDVHIAGAMIEGAGGTNPNIQGPAMTLSHSLLAFRPGGVDAVIGKNNKSNAIAFDGKLAADLVWRDPPTQPDSDVPQGHALSGPLEVPAPFTMQLTHSSHIMEKGLTFTGGHLDATAGDAHITADPYTWGSNVQLSPSADGTVPATARLVGATLQASLIADMGAIVPTASAAQLDIRSSVVTTSLRTTNTSVYVIDSTTVAIRATSSPTDIEGSTTGALLIDEAVTPVVLRNNHVNVCNDFPVRVEARYTGRVDTIATGNVVQSCSGGAVGYAMSLDGVHTTIGPNGVEGNLGANNGVDAIAMSGDIYSDVALDVGTNSSQVHLLGIAVSNDATDYRPYDTGLIVHGEHTVTVPRNGVLRIHGSQDFGMSAVTLLGGNLDIQSGAIVTSTGDPTPGTDPCNAPPPCSRTTALETFGIKVHADPATGHAGWVRVAGAHFFYGPLIVDNGAQSAPGSQFGVTVANSTFDSSYIDVTGSPSSITATTTYPHQPYAPDHDLPLYRPGISLHKSSGNVITGSRLGARADAAVWLDYATATMDRDSFFLDSAPALGFGNIGIGGFGGSAVKANGQPVAMSCLSVHDLYAGLQLSNGSSLRDSDLYNNVNFPSYGGDRTWDLAAGGRTVTARQVWWGQAGGPTSNQIDTPSTVDASDPATSQAPTAVITSTDTNMGPGRTYEQGDVTVNVAFNRAMDMTLQPVVTLTGADTQAHSISGDWQDARTWVGHYKLTSTDAVPGPNRIEASSARSCVPDPASNLMQPGHQDVIVDNVAVPQEPPAQQASAVIDSGPPSNSWSGSNVTFVFHTSGGTDETTVCTLDGAAGPCSSQVQYTLTSGTHHFSVTPMSGGWAGNSASRDWHVDAVAPDALMTPLPSEFTTASKVDAQWSGADLGGSGLATYDVRYQTRTKAGVVSPWQQPAELQGITATSGTAPASPGYSLCFAVRVRDGVGNVSDWSLTNCVTRLSDDRSLARHGTWTSKSGGGFYLGTATQSTTKGSSLSFGQVKMSSLALLAKTCTACGSVDVVLDGRTIASFSLAQSSSPSQLFSFTSSSGNALSGELSIVVISPRGRVVAIDGLAVSPG
jgi:hypothetical protein